MGFPCWHVMNEMYILGMRLVAERLEAAEYRHRGGQNAVCCKYRLAGQCLLKINPALQGWP